MIGRDAAGSQLVIDRLFGPGFEALMFGPLFVAIGVNNLPLLPGREHGLRRRIDAALGGAQGDDALLLAAFENAMVIL